MRYFVPLLLLVASCAAPNRSVYGSIHRAEVTHGDFDDLSPMPGLGAGMLTGGSSLVGEFAWTGVSDEDTIDGASVDLTRHEFGLGGRWYVDRSGWFQPYVGAGVSYVWGDFSNSHPPIGDGEWSWGYYGRAGVDIDLGAGWFLGTDFRYLGGVDIADTPVDGAILGLMFRYEF